MKCNQSFSRKIMENTLFKQDTMHLTPVENKFFFHKIPTGELQEVMGLCHAHDALTHQGSQLSRSSSGAMT
jgi:hypothetical protein